MPPVPAGGQHRDGAQRHLHQVPPLWDQRRYGALLRRYGAKTTPGYVNRFLVMKVAENLLQTKW